MTQMSSNRGVRVVACGKTFLCMDCFVARYGNTFERAYEGRGQVGVCSECLAGKPPASEIRQQPGAMRAYEDQFKSFFERDSRHQYGPRSRR